MLKAAKSASITPVPNHPLLGVTVQIQAPVSPSAGSGRYAGQRGKLIGVSLIDTIRGEALVSALVVGLDGKLLGGFAFSRLRVV